MSKFWPDARLGEIIREEREAVGSINGNDLPVLGVTNKAGVTTTGVEASNDRSKYLRLRPGRFVYNPYRINVGSIGFTSEEQDGICSPAYVVFLPTERIEAKFLHFFLKSTRGDQLINFYGNRGSVRSALRFNDLAQIEIPLPPLAEQRRIVARIEELAAQIHKARALREHAAAESEALFASRVSALFRDASCWSIVKSAVSPRPGTVRSGPFGSQLLHEEFVGSGIAAIGTRDVQINHFELRGGWFVRPEKFEALRRYQVFPGDILCTIVGASIGRFCVVPDEVPMAFTTKHIQALTLDCEKASPEFVSFMLNFHRRCRESLFAQVEGSAQPSLNAQKVLGTALPLPDLNEQRRIVAELDTLQAEVDALKRHQRDTAAELDALLPALLDRAFKGEL